MSVSLSYSASAISVFLGSRFITPSGVCTRLVVDKISSLITTPVSFKPALSNIFLASLANLFNLPSSID